jgi:hypothetical protein
MYDVKLLPHTVVFYKIWYYFRCTSYLILLMFVLQDILIEIESCHTDLSMNVIVSFLLEFCNTWAGIFIIMIWKWLFKNRIGSECVFLFFMGALNKPYWAFCCCDVLKTILTAIYNCKHYYYVDVIN